MAEESPPIYNVTLYDYQGLQFVDHILDITIVSWQLGESAIALDYIDINDSYASNNTVMMPATLAPIYAGLGSTFAMSPLIVKRAIHEKR